jgi:hypothetical protein
VAVEKRAVEPRREGTARVVEQVGPDPLLPGHREERHREPVSIEEPDETLSEGLRRTLDGLVGVNTSTKADASKTREDRLKEAGVEMKVLTSEHPVVRTHPETGRRALYVNQGHTARFKGWTEEESRPLLDHLFRHQVRLELTCRFQWQPGSIAFWDNRCVQHNAVNDYPGFKRLMHRVTLAGDTPRKTRPLTCRSSGACASRRKRGRPRGGPRWCARG